MSKQWRPFNNCDTCARRARCYRSGDVWICTECVAARLDDATCAICGQITTEPKTPRGTICRPCILVCVDMAFDRLAGAMLRHEPLDAQAAPGYNAKGQPGAETRLAL